MTNVLLSQGLPEIELSHHAGLNLGPRFTTDNIDTPRLRLVESAAKESAHTYFNVKWFGIGTFTVAAACEGQARSSMVEFSKQQPYLRMPDINQVLPCMVIIEPIDGVVYGDLDFIPGREEGSVQLRTFTERLLHPVKDNSLRHTLNPNQQQLDLGDANN